MEFKNNSKEFYVYAYLDPRHIGEYAYTVNNKTFSFDFMPRYIGKGWDGITESNQKYSRINNHFSFVNYRRTPFYDWLKMILKLGYTKEQLKEKYIIKFIMKNENEALKLEKDLIDVIGRKDLKTGNLLNLCDGGLGSNNLAKSVKDKISNNRKGKGTGINNTNYRKGYKVTGENNPFYGKKHDNKTILKMKRWYIFEDVINMKKYIIFNFEKFCLDFNLSGAIYRVINKNKIHKKQWIGNKIDKESYNFLYEENIPYKEVKL